MTTTNVLLFQLINSSNTKKYKIKPTDVVASDPQLDISTANNSKIQLTALPGSGLKGDLWVHYSRESIGNLHLPTQLLSELTITVESILAVLNAHLLVPVTADDLESFSVPVLNVGDILAITLSARSGSFAWIGSMDFTVLYGLPPNVDDVSAIMNVGLPTYFKPL